MTDMHFHFTNTQHAFGSIYRDDAMLPSLRTWADLDTSSVLQRARNSLDRVFQSIPPSLQESILDAEVLSS